MNKSEIKKKYLRENLEEFDESKTVEENLYANKFRKFFDCGSNVYVRK